MMSSAVFVFDVGVFRLNDIVSMLRGFSFLIRGLQFF